MSGVGCCVKKDPMRSVVLIYVLISCLSSFAQKQLPNVGDIAFDPAVDDPGFRICYEPEIFQYYNFGKGLQYEGEKIKIVQHFQNNYKSKEFGSVQGFITIRFIVNCEGKTGRFRIQEMDNHYNAAVFPKALTDQLLELTKMLEGWTPAAYEGTKMDYYQYLTFKIENGDIKEIMP